MKKNDQKNSSGNAQQEESWNYWFLSACDIIRPGTEIKLYLPGWADKNEA
jgi:hypothetical protein